MTTPDPGSVNFVLVPGAGGSAWYWHRLVTELEARGHTAVAVDLPAADDSAGLDAYADTIVTAAQGLDDVVLVAQSMGGLSAPLACDRLPVSLLVLVNAMIPRPGESGGQWWEATGQAQAADEFAASQVRPTNGELDLMETFFHDVPTDVVAAAVEAGEPKQSDTPFGQPFPLERWPEVPTRVIASSDDRLFPAKFQRRLAMERLGVTPDEVPGGHLVALARPAALADRLEAYATDVSASGSATSDEPPPPSENHAYLWLRLNGPRAQPVVATNSVNLSEGALPVMGNPSLAGTLQRVHGVEEHAAELIVSAKQPVGDSQHLASRISAVGRKQHR